MMGIAFTTQSTLRLTLTLTCKRIPTSLSLVARHLRSRIADAASKGHGFGKTPAERMKRMIKQLHIVQRGPKHKVSFQVAIVSGWRPPAYPFAGNSRHFADVQPQLVCIFRSDARGNCGPALERRDPASAAQAISGADEDQITERTPMLTAEPSSRISALPFGSRQFSDLTHYVRSGDFVREMLLESQDANEYAFAHGRLSALCLRHCRPSGGQPGRGD